MPDIIKERRLGKFDIGFEIIRKYPQPIKEFLSKVLIVEAKSTYHKQCIEYVGYSEEFDRLEIGQEPKYYPLGFTEEIVEEKGKEIVKNVEFNFIPFNFG